MKVNRWAGAPVKLSADLGRGLLSDETYRLLRDSMVSGVFRPGQRLVESEIARQLNISQSPVRDALRRLAHEGLVIQFPRRGSYVAELSTDEARDTYVVRATLERLAAAKACENPAPQLLAELEREVSAMRAAAATDDAPGFVEADIAFHHAVWEASGNRFLPRVWTLVQGSMRNFTLISNRLYFNDLGEIAETHTPLVAALKAGDPAAAAALFEEHVFAVWERIEQSGRRVRRDY